MEDWNQALDEFQTHCEECGACYYDGILLGTENDLVVCPCESEVL